MDRSGDDRAATGMSWRNIQDGTKLVHQKWTSARGVLRIMEPFMRRALLQGLRSGWAASKRILEEGEGERG